MARKKKSKGLRVSLMLTVGLMIVSFAAGMLTQRIVFREPQTDAGLTYIEDIPVMTDFFPRAHAPSGTEARDQVSCHPRDRQHRHRRKCGRAQLIHPPDANAGEGIVSWHYTVDDHEIYHHLPDDETAYHAGDGMEKNGGNMNGIGIEMMRQLRTATTNRRSSTPKSCAARLLIEYD